MGPIEHISELVGEFATREEEVSPHTEVDCRESLIWRELGEVLEESLDTEGEEVESEEMYGSVRSGVGHFELHIVTLDGEAVECERENVRLALPEKEGSHDEGVIFPGSASMHIDFDLLRGGLDGEEVDSLFEVGETEERVALGGNELEGGVLVRERLVGLVDSSE